MRRRNFNVLFVVSILFWFPPFWRYSMKLIAFPAKVYNTARILRAHVKRSHNKVKGESKCTHCRMVFQDKLSLREHIRNHSPIDKQQCEICNREFQNRYTLKVHMKLHVGGEFECTFCRKRFTNARDLDIHTRFHTGDYPHKCEVCGKKFNIKSHLNSHMEVHSDAVYDCPHCDYTCKTKASIRQHRFIHEGMPHICHFCGKGFNARNKYVVFMFCYLNLLCSFDLFQDKSSS